MRYNTLNGCDIIWESEKNFFFLRLLSTYMSLANVSGLDDLSFHCDVEPDDNLQVYSIAKKNKNLCE